MSTQWEDLVTNKTKYTDDTILKMADGTEVRLGDARGGYMKDADYRQKTALLARQREEFESHAASRLQAIQEGEAQLLSIAGELVRQNPGLTPRQEDQLVNADPEVRQLRNEIAEMKKATTQIGQYLGNMEQQSKLARQNFVVNEHRRALLELKAQDPSLDEPALVQWAKENHTPNLKVAYRAMNHEALVNAAVTKAREDAMREGYEKARGEVAAPMIPLRHAMAPLPDNAPKDLNSWKKDVVGIALSDPDIQKAMSGQLPG